MRNIATTVIIVMVASLVVSITVVPMVAARLLRRESTRKHPFFERLSALYGVTLRFTLRHRLAFSLSIVVLLVASWNLYQGIARSRSSRSFERQVVIQVDVPVSYTVEQKRGLYDEVYRLLDQRREELEIASVSYEFRRGSGRSRGWSRDNRIEVFLLDEEQSTLNTGQIRDRVMELMPRHPGVVFTIARSMRGHRGSGSSVEFRLTGDNPEILEVVSRTVMETLRAVPGLRDVDSSVESSDEEIIVRPDRERALQAGLSSQAVGMSVSSALSSRAVSYFEMDDRELDMVVQFREQDRQTLDQLQKMPVAFGRSPQPLGAVASFETAPGARSIERENRRASLTVTADTASGTPSFAVMGPVRGALAGLALPSGYELDMGSEFRESVAEEESAVFMLLFALLLVYMVMAALFESFAQPFTIMFSVPFALVGVGFIMRLAGQPRGRETDMGLIILAGIVVNNAIVLVDHINRLRRQGLPRDEAIVVGGRHRLRPILMTAMTTILGLSPMVAPFFFPQVFGALEGRAAFWAPVGLVIMGGLTTSTFFTVMVIPTIYSLVDDLTVMVRRVVASA
jgi:HAE1 family hydrophobic/amphiphilic exporter-1